VAILQNLVQRIWGVFHPVSGALLGVTTSGETPYFPVNGSFLNFPSVAGVGSIHLVPGTVGVTAASAGCYLTPGDGGGGLYLFNPLDITSGCFFLGSISGTALTVASVFNGAIAIGQNVYGPDGAAVGRVIAGAGASWTLSGSGSTAGNVNLSADTGGTILTGLDGGRWYLTSGNGAASAPTNAETAAGVTPTNYNYPEIMPRRYGADGTGGAADSTALAAVRSVLGALAMQLLQIGWIGSILNPRTATEIAGSISPTSYAYPAGNVLRYGADPTGVADSTAAFLNAYAAVPAGGVVRMPAGSYVFSSQVVFGSKGLAWVGDGARQTQLYYAGANTTNDCFVFGDGVTQVVGSLFSGIGFHSNTTMTAGVGVHLKELARNAFYDVLFDDEDGTGKFWNAVYFHNVDFCFTVGFQAKAQNDGAQVSGASGHPQADLFLINGKIGGCQSAGLRCGGGFGGLYLDACDIIGNATNVVVDQTLQNQTNREVLLGPGVALDSAGTTGAPFGGINLDLQSPVSMFLQNTWLASADILVRIGAAFGGYLHMTGGILFNALTAPGGHGYLIQYQAAGNFNVIFDGTYVNNIQGTLATCASPTVVGLIFRPSRVDGSSLTITNVTLLAEPHPSGLVVGGYSIYAAASSGTPGLVDYSATTTRAHFFNDANPSWLEFDKSRNPTQGSHTIVQNNDSLGGVLFAGSDGSVFVSSSAIQGVVAAAPSSGKVPGQLLFSTATAAGAFTSALIIGDDQSTAPAVDNSFTCGKSGLRWSAVWAANGTIQTSDARLKTDIQPIDGAQALEFVMRLKPVTYRWLTGGRIVTGTDLAGKAILSPQPGVRRHAGHVAQDLKSAMDSTVGDFGAWGLVDIQDPTSEQWTRPDERIPYLEAALQHLCTRVAELERLKN
jgi:Chaperone of endosialidase/Pectate lyase superfamily protein